MYACATGSSTSASWRDQSKDTLWIQIKIPWDDAPSHSNRTTVVGWVVGDCHQCGCQGAVLMEEFEECDEDDSSSDDGGILFSRSLLKGERASTNGRSSAGTGNDATSSPSAMTLVYQPGAILQCFELAVASHDNPDPSMAPMWEAPPLSNPVQAQQPQADAAPPVDEGSDGEILPHSSSSSLVPASHASILRDWKPRKFPEPDWMKMSEDVSSGASASVTGPSGNGLAAVPATDTEQYSAHQSG
jgi:hypothetical protein